MKYYLAIQYSAIQKAVLRHDRLWSISGISHTIVKLNEIKMREIVRQKRGHVILAGGGKLTACFENIRDAEEAKEELIRTISTNLPMLEFQVSSIVPAHSLTDAQKTVKENEYYPGLIHELSEKKLNFRGYGVTYNPHFAACDECEEYPQEKELIIADKSVCRICYTSWEKARVDLERILNVEDEKLSSMEKIYKSYRKTIRTQHKINIPLNMEDMFDKKYGEDSEKHERIAVWVSDINNMNRRIVIWNSQEEAKILKTYDKLRDLFIEAIIDTLTTVFPEQTLIKRGNELFIPFRLVVAGGDDLCIVMPSNYVTNFVLAYSASLSEKIKNSSKYDETLTKEWLDKKLTEMGEKNVDIGEISFGGAFVVTPIHTPFAKIHALGEALMSEAKKKTERKGNSVNWQILSVDEETFSDEVLQRREKPLLVEARYRDFLSFRDYNELCSQYETISKSHTFSIIEAIMEVSGDGKKLKRYLLRIPEAHKAGSKVAQMLDDRRFYKNGSLDAARILTMFELINLKKKDQNE
ncbi:MAG: hypothetical protein N2513_09625 [Deltaproteobacteria bacterium]|nr:hypothetical protein [Deltaproteobacteria bacterium]